MADRSQYQALARQYANQYHIPPSVFLAQINQESGFNPNAKSGAGALGIAQIVPKWHPGVDPMDPKAALNYAAKWDSQNFKKYGNWNDTLSVYNSGRPWAVGRGFGETANYVKTILSNAGQWKGAGPVAPGSPATGQPLGTTVGDSSGNPAVANTRATLLNYVQNANNAYSARVAGIASPPPSLAAALQAAKLTAGAQGASGGLSGADPDTSHPAAPGSIASVNLKGLVPFLGSTDGEKPAFLGKLSQAVQALGGTKVRINSGYRTAEHNAAIHGAPKSNHLTGDAMDGDVFIPGKGWVPLGTALINVAPKFGLRSGATFNWGGKPDVVHVDDLANQ